MVDIIFYVSIRASGEANLEEVTPLPNKVYPPEGGGFNREVSDEKPGCRNNARQKDLLRAAGHTLEVRDLLSAAWSAETLRPFFGNRPVAEWFNRAAPRVKSGEVIPEVMDAGQALALMMADPLLIRRPLMESGGRRMAGFDPEEMDIWIPLSVAGYAELMMTTPENCQRPTPCPPPRRQTAAGGDPVSTPAPS